MHIVWLMLVLLIPIPLYIAFQSFFIKERNKEGIGAVEGAYKRVIKRYGLRISEVSKFINRLIAIDRKIGKLVLIVYKDGITWEKCVGLQEIGGCQIARSTDHASGFVHQVNMELVLHYTREIISFPFFDEKIDDVRDLDRRTRQAHYWQKKVCSSREK